MAELCRLHRKLLLMLDFDGTLVPIEDTPEKAIPTAETLHTLKILANNRDIVLAIISGRDIEDLMKIIPLEEVILAGGHGAEISFPGGNKIQYIKRSELSPLLAFLADRIRKIIAVKKGFLVEEKKTSLAVHYRLAESNTATEVLSIFRNFSQPYMERFKLEYLEGKKVLEVRPKLVNKGTAVGYLKAKYAEYYPVYIGDDTTDEDAFKIIKACGTSVLVAEEGHPTAADIILKEQGEVLKFLQILHKRG